MALPSLPINVPPKSMVCPDKYNVFQRLVALPKLYVLSVVGTKLELTLLITFITLVVTVFVNLPFAVEIFGAKSNLKGVV